MLNFRVSDEEAALLAEYAEESGQSMTDVVRGFIRSLEPKIRRVTSASVKPELLPSLPLTRLGSLPSLEAAYFVLTEAGEVLYIGQTKHLARRHEFRHNHRDGILAIDPHARIHWIEMRNGRHDFERACIKRFSPRLNGTRGAGPDKS